NVFVWFARFNNPAAYERHIAALTQSPRCRDEISKALSRRLKRAPEVLKLSPTTRSLVYRRLQFFARRRSLLFRRALLGIQFKSAFHLVVLTLDKSRRRRLNRCDLFI